MSFRVMFNMIENVGLEKTGNTCVSYMEEPQYESAFSYNDEMDWKRKLVRRSSKYQFW